MKKILFCLTMLLAGAFTSAAQQMQPRKLERKPVLLVSNWKLEYDANKVKISGEYYNLTSKPLSGIVGQLQCIDAKGQPLSGREDTYTLPSFAAKGYQIGFSWEASANLLRGFKTCTATISVKDKNTLVKQGEFVLQNNSPSEGQ